MIADDRKQELILMGLSRQVNTAGGVSPTDGGYRLDMRDGTSRAATGDEIAAATAWADAQLACPQVITRAQARKAMVLAGVTPAMIEKALSSLSEPAQTFARIDWEDATEVHRGNALVASLGGSLGLTADRLDGLFRQAAAL